MCQRSYTRACSSSSSSSSSVLARGLTAAYGLIRSPQTRRSCSESPRISEEEEEDEEGEEKEDGWCPALTSCCCCCCRSVCCSTLRRSDREGGGRRLLHAGRKLPLPWQPVASRRRRESLAFSSQVAHDEVPTLYMQIKAA